jgi:hypothetical protein
VNVALQEVMNNWVSPAVWGLVATAIMTSVLQSAQLVGLSRRSLTFLFGTFVVSGRRKAVVWGFALYLLGGSLFAFLYALLFATLGRSDWWIGLLLGAAHGLFLIAVFLPTLPYIHPRLAPEFDGPDPIRRIEPAGAFGLNYGRNTPLVTVLAQTAYGIVLALGYD